MFQRLRSWLVRGPTSASDLSDVALRSAIKEREAQGHTGATDPTLDALNREQTNRLSDQEIQDQIRARTAAGEPVGKLVSAARDRGIPISTGDLSDVALRSAIKEREAQGHTGRTDSATHALNVAQTNRLSTSQISSLIAERQAQGKPTGKLEAALRDRS